MYEAFATAVSNNDAALDFLSSLPPPKQQPNLLFAAVRKVCGLAATGEDFCQRLRANEEPVRTLMLARSTQTNEPARCATLLPILSQLPQPIALLEVGTSAGLCLYPDRYEYAYGDHQLGSQSAAAPQFSCEANQHTPLPAALPDVVWRAGIDLNPLDLEDDDNVAWLETLVWPEQTTRLENLRRAIDVARSDPPLLFQGDLVEVLGSVASQAPGDATLVIFHSAVLAYVPEAALRAQFVEAVSKLDATWISNEHPTVFPTIAATMDVVPPNDQFLLCVDGEPVATTGPHGQSIHWYPADQAQSSYVSRDNQ